MCSTPVTFGGGITMQKDFLSGFGLELNSFFSNQNEYHLFSTSDGLYLVESSMIKR